MAFNNVLNENSTGFQSLASSGVSTGRTLTATANQTSITNTDGTGGNPVVSLTSTIYVSGISFDSGSNTLSNYATGTWSPVFNNQVAPPTVSYSVQLGRYTRIGNRVFLNANITLSAYGAGTGNCRISNMPFTSAGTGQSLWMLSIQNTNIVAGLQWFSSQIGFNATIIAFNGSKTAAVQGGIQNTDPTNTTIVAATVSHEV
jgi:hypothetical protein